MRFRVRGYWRWYFYVKTSSHLIAPLPLKRVALDSTILTVKNMGFDGLLRTLMSPPKKDAVESAMKSLSEVGAVERLSGKITNLGRLLAGLPVSVGVGKMMIFGVLLGCRDVVLTIAAGMALQRSPFMKNMAPRKQWKRRRNYLKYLHDDELGEWEVDRR